MQYFRQAYQVRNKSTYDLVSDADINAEKAICEVIKREFPHHAILGEEFSRAEVNTEHLWIVDPLDGTNNFVHGIEHFAVSIGYFHNGDPQVGVVFRPTTGDWFVSQKSKGAWRNEVAVGVNTCQSLNQVLVGVGFYYDRGRQMQSTLAAVKQLFETDIHGIRRMGTASLDLCMVGCGHFGAYFEFELSPWDFAAGALFVAEAGGLVTSCDGGEMPIGKSSVLATNSILHDDMLRIVQPHFRECADHRSTPSPG